MTTILRARALVKAYSGTPALRGLDLELAEGEVLAVTGASGSGNSTLLHCLSGIVVPDAGEVHFGDLRVDGASEKLRSELRRTAFGVLFQFGQLVPELTAAENVALPLLLDGRPRGGALAAARTWLERLGVDDQHDSRPGQMSGGQAVNRVTALRGDVDQRSADLQVAGDGRSDVAVRPRRHGLNWLTGSATVPTHCCRTQLTFSGPMPELSNARSLRPGARSRGRGVRPRAGDHSRPLRACDVSRRVRPADGPAGG